MPVPGPMSRTVPETEAMRGGIRAEEPTAWGVGEKESSSREAGRWRWIRAVFGKC